LSSSVAAMTIAQASRMPADAAGGGLALTQRLMAEDDHEVRIALANAPAP
jgi:hypothetical protein